MNKQIFFAVLVAISPTLKGSEPKSTQDLSFSQLMDPTEMMYFDIKSIIEDPVTGKDDAQRLQNVQDVLQQVKMYKKNMQNNIIYLHSQGRDSKAVLLGNILAGIGATALTILGGYFAYNSERSSHTSGILFASAYSVAAIPLVAWAFNKQKIASKKDKIVDLNKVIVRLEAMETELYNKITIDSVITE
jgi:hypothetical protein